MSGRTEGGATERRPIRASGPKDRSTLEGDRTGRAIIVIILLAIALIVIALAGLTAGASDASFLRAIADWLSHTNGSPAPLSERDRIIIYDIRMPRVAMGVLIGAALAVSGAVMQGLFRNPLADPGLIGVSAGAALGAVSMIVLSGTLLAPVAALAGIYALPLAAFLGGLAVTLLLYRISTRQGQTSVATMLLAGIGLAALAGALLGLLVYIADDRQLRDLTFWSLGSLAGATWAKLAAVGPIVALSLAVTPFLARGLNGLSLGEASARHLGVPVQSLKHTAIFTVAAATGASVAVSGTIGFIGIVVPHLLRLAIGPDNRLLLPAAALGGACLLLVADTISRTIVAPAELPIGIVTAAAGAPVFLWILLRRRGLADI
ncbi:iron ABC transporter permease [Mesorhizobium sp. BAC0120]|uniref:FecCD family ABC transporter permease n=1 Tax=Mesorhizobium sp. BAC0120 TaxID=3090670 RepID=UPI00298C2126|nr:iron ABC transporter permease [Mesorhizobium sp. BAC0120]MDW6025834.1 iron ABC transporter permease [Mesorhizobium sp. BAC0120]